MVNDSTSKILQSDSPFGIRSRMLKGLGSSAFAQFVLVLQHILLVPFFLEAWGADGYGRWLALSAFISYLSLLDLGGQAYIANLLAIKHAEKDWNEFSKVLSEGVSLFLFIGTATLIVFLGGMWVFSIYPTPGLGRTLESWEVWVLVLLGFQLLFLQIPCGVYGSVYRATGLYARGTMLGNLIRGLGILISLILLVAKVSAIVFAVGVVLVSLLTAIVLIRDSRRVIPVCRELSIEWSSFKQGFRHFNGSLYFWLMALAQTVKNQGVLLVAAYFLPPALVAVLTTHRTLSNLSGYIGVLFQGPALPELSFLWAEKRMADFKRISFLGIRIVVFLTGASAIFVWLLTPKIYNEWTRGELQISYVLLGILLVQAILAGGWQTACWGVIAVNRHQSIAFAFLGNSITTILLALWFAPQWGIEGIACAGILADLIFGFLLYPYLAANFLEVSPIKIFGQILRAMMGVVPLGVVAYICFSLFAGWSGIGAYCFFSLLIVYPLFVFVAGKDETARCISFAKSLLIK
jgi:O-antigen/teichoic acid export membrane protein